MRRYFSEIGIHEYFIHQPEGERPPEFRGWRRRGDGYAAILPDERGALYSEALNLLFSTEDLPNKLRFMRPYLPDGTPLVTLTESKAETAAARAEAAEAKMRVEVAESRAAQAQADADAAMAEAKMLAATHTRIISELQADMVRLREAVERQHPSEN